MSPRFIGGAGRRRRVPLHDPPRGGAGRAGLTARATPHGLICVNAAPALIARATALGIERVLEKPPTEDLLLAFVERHRVPAPQR
jgi:hypothetical protein